MPTLDNSLGAAYLGLLAAAILYGMTSIQTFLYFRNAKDDTTLLKSMVIFLWVLDTIHFAFIAQGLYFYLITNFGEFEVLNSLTWTFLASIYITNISDLAARWFFSRRIYIFCGERKMMALVLTTVITLLSLLAFASGCGFASRGFILKTYQRLNEAAPMLYISFGSAVVADTSIAASLCVLLFKSRIGFESKRMDSVLTMLMTYSINTGLLTSLCAIACFVTYAIWPRSLIYAGIYFTLTKLYVNALLASLNARNTLRHHGRRTPTMSIPTGILSSIAFPAPVSATTGSLNIICDNCKRESGIAEIAPARQEAFA